MLHGERPYSKSLSTRQGLMLMLRIWHVFVRLGAISPAKSALFRKKRWNDAGLERSHFNIWSTVLLFSKASPELRSTTNLFNTCNIRESIYVLFFPTIWVHHPLPQWRNFIPLLNIWIKYSSYSCPLETPKHPLDPLPLKSRLYF